MCSDCTRESEGDVIAVGVVGLYDVDDGVESSVLADQHVLYGLYEDRCFVVDIGDADPDIGRAAVCRRAVVYCDYGEVVRMTDSSVVVQASETQASDSDGTGQKLTEELRTSSLFAYF